MNLDENKFCFYRGKKHVDRNKFCIFCGKKPENKNNEHVIPRWLIELTGDPKRKAYFGINYNNSASSLRMYSFDSFVFPSCMTCNSDYGKLEGIVKPIILNLLNENGISDVEFSFLLDWLDKVRIGLWLGYNYLDGNDANITPSFHINSRVGKRDRQLIIYKVKYFGDGLNFVGVDGPSFQWMPSCFGLRINNYYLYNTSTFNLCDRRLGFPYSKESYYADSKLIAANYSKGLERKFYPVIRKSFLNGGVKLYQPIFSETISNENVRDLYFTDYVKANSINLEKGLGGVFIEKKNKIENYGSVKSKNWIPKTEYRFESFAPQLTQSVYNMQEYLFLNGSSMEEFTKEKRRHIKKTYNFMKRINEKYVGLMKDRIESLVKSK